MVYPILDMNNNVVTPTIVLCHRNKHKIGAIYPISEWSITPNMYNKNECSFKVYKEVNGIATPLWDQIKDLKVIYIPEYNEYFQISIDKTQTNETVKTITGSNLGIAELSQTMLYDIEINTEDDIARDAYKMAYIYDPTDISSSLLGRVLSKAPHYKIKHVDASLCKLVRSFSINDKSIYDFLTGDLADELNCLVWVDSYDRSISIYDLENSCPKCGHRAENETVCSKCRTTMTRGYGEYFNVPVSNDNLSDSITVTTKDDEVKNTFRIQGGDDVINAAIRAVNPNGTEYINRFAAFQTEDMSKELIDQINAYQELYESKKKPYKEIMNGLYDTIDQILYLTSSMMPSPETDDTDANKELAKLTADNLGMIAVQNLRVAGVTTVNNAVKSMADIYMSAGYKVEIASSIYSNQVWNGRFKVTSVDDENDTVTNGSDITLLITDDYETFITQKIQKILDKQDMSDEEYDWTKYGLNRLSSFSDAYQSCIDMLIDSGVGDPNHEFYASIYLVYYNKKLEVDKEIQVREAQIKEQEDKEAEYEKQRDNIQTELNFEKYLGKDLYSEYCLYRREDTYQNDNYISDGLSNSEILSKAEELLEVAQKEIVKASELQVDLSTDVGNIWTIDEFKDVLDQWKCGNWIRVICDDDIYELRLLNYTIKDSDFSKISCDFSSVLKVSDGISDIKSVLDSAKSMAGSYESVKRQAKNAQETGKTVSEWVEHGMNATAVAIRDSDSQSITYDNHGLLARTYDDITGEYEPEQLKVVNNTLAITDDNWKTVKAAIGKIHYEDPKHPGDMLSAYGVLGETIIGKLLLGEALGIYNDGGSLKFDKNGLSISNGTNSFVVNPNDETLISLSNNNGKILWVDTKGGLHLRGDGSGLDITSNEAISGVSSAISQLNDEIVLKVDDNGRLATVKLGADANEGTVVQIGADSINLTAEETINFLSGGEINLSGKNISIKSDNFNVTKDGKMSCKGATIDGDVVANTLTANTKGSIAGFDISSNGLSVSVTETLPTYSNADITRLQQIIVGLVTPTQADYNRLDMNYDGRLTTLDIAAIQRLLNGTDSYTQTSTFLLNPKSVKHTIEISNGNNKTTIGAKSIASPSVSATAAYGNSVATNNLLVGHTNDSNGIKHISCGTVTCDGSGGTSVILSGVVGSSNCAFFLTNADASLSSAHIDGSQINGTTVYANLDRALNSGHKIKIAWVKFEW
nr:MAG TPA: tail protein [Caudoviricetes sp.]